MFWGYCFPGTWSSHKGLCCGIKGYYRPKNETHDLPVSTPVENHTTTMLPEIVVTAPRQQRELFTTPINIEIKPIKIEPIKLGKWIKL